MQIPKPTAPERDNEPLRLTKRIDTTTYKVTVYFSRTSKLTSEQDGQNDYTRKRGVVHTEILRPSHAPPEYADRAVLWNAVKKSETPKNAQLAWEIEVALPAELPMEQNIALAREFVQRQFVSAAMCADVCVHEAEKGKPLAHIMFTMRPINEDGTW